MNERTHKALHTLWTKAKNAPGYDKAEWRDLEASIESEREAVVKAAEPVLTDGEIAAIKFKLTCQPHFEDDQMGLDFYSGLAKLAARCGVTA